MEKQIEKSGKDFAGRCMGCPALLRFNWQRSRGRDVVYVVCREECIKPVEVAVDAEKKEVKR